MNPALLHAAVSASLTGEEFAGQLKVGQAMLQHWDSLHLGRLQRTSAASSIKAKPYEQVMESQNGFAGVVRQRRLNWEGEFVAATEGRSMA